MKKGKIAVFALMLSTLSVFPSSAGWVQEENGWWWYQNEDGSYPTDGWLWIDGNGDGIAEKYLFDKKGWMLEDTTTPDGFFVNADGAWSFNGVVQTTSDADRSNRELQDFEKATIKK